MLSSRESIEHRLSRIEIQIRGLTQMVEDDRDCAEVLIRIAALRSALISVGSMMFSKHVEDLVRSSGDCPEKVKGLRDMMDQFLR